MRQPGKKNRPVLIRSVNTECYTYLFHVLIGRFFCYGAAFGGDMTKNAQSSKYYQWLAWGTVGYTLLVIMFGAFVRATGSGAGCGEHWPLCNGVIIPRPEQIETIIEFTHRITSGLLLIMVLIGVIWAYRKFPKGHATRHGATLSLVFVVIEAAIGAGLVLLQLVEENATPLRAVAVGAHLFNTFLLLAVMTYTAWYASRGYAERFRIRAKGKAVFMIIAGLVLYGLVGATGAITALGDTLFPVGSLAVEGAATHFLIKLRVIHPILAVAVALFVTKVPFHTSTAPATGCRSAL